MSDLDQLPIAGDRFAIRLTLNFGGAIPKDGLDADEVAAVADGMAKAVQFLSSRAIDSERQYTLHLTEVRPGSAIFQFVLEASALAQTFLPILPSNAFSIHQIGQVFSNTIKLLDFLKGKPPSVVSTVHDGTNVIIQNSAGAKISVSQHIYHFAGNAYFQEQAEKATKPLKKQQRTLHIMQDKHDLLQAESESYTAISARPINDNQPLTINTIEATLRVRQPHLDSENSWKFAWGRNQITARVQDRGFMEKVRAGEEEFRSGDVLRVKLRIEEQQRGKNITKHHFIDEVLHRERGP